MNFISFKPSVLYALAAPSTPESVIDQAVAKAESGDKVTVAKMICVFPHIIFLSRFLPGFPQLGKARPLAHDLRSEES